MNASRPRLSNTPRAARPVLLAPAALALAGGILVSSWLGEVPSVWRMGAALLVPLVAFVTWAAPRTKAGTLLPPAVCASAALLGFVRHQQTLPLDPWAIERLASPTSEWVRVVGRVASAARSDDPPQNNPYLPQSTPLRTRFLLQVETLRGLHDEQRVFGFVRVTVRRGAITLREGERIEAIGRLQAPRGPRNPGERDLRPLLGRADAAVTLVLDDAEAILRREPATAGWLRWRERLRLAGRAALLESVEPHSGDASNELLDALVLGHRSGVSPALNEAFRRTASIHILSVSGFHVAVVAALTWWLLQRVPRMRTGVAVCVTALVLVTYATLAEADAPILRATLMGLLALAARWLGRPLSAANWLALAALALLLLDPREMHRPGFQLSFAQVAALVVAGGAWRDATARAFARDSGWAPDDAAAARARRTPDHVLLFLARYAGRVILIAAAAALLAWATALPLVIAHFGLITPWGALQSLLLTPLFSLAIMLGFATLVAGAVLPPAGAALRAILHPAMDGLAWIVTRLGDWPGSEIALPTVSPLVALFTYAAAIGIYALLRRAPAAPRAAGRLALAAMLMIAIVLVWRQSARTQPIVPQPADAARLAFFDAGNGLAGLIISPKGRTLALNPGTERNLDAGALTLTAARALGAAPPRGCVVTVGDTGAASGLATLCQASVERVWLHPGAWRYLPARGGRDPAARPTIAAAWAHEFRELDHGLSLDVDGLRLTVPPNAGGEEPASIARPVLLEFGESVALLLHGMSAPQAVAAVEQQRAAPPSKPVDIAHSGAVDSVAAAVPARFDALILSDAALRDVSDLPRLLELTAPHMVIICARELDEMAREILSAGGAAVRCTGEAGTVLLDLPMRKERGPAQTHTPFQVSATAARP